MRVAPLSETDNPEDDKVYVFFTECAQEAEGAAGKVLYSRVARVCKVWSVFVRERQRPGLCVCLCAYIRNCLHVVYVNMCLPEQVRCVRAGQCVCLRLC